jgi:hypothetical protein
MTKKLNINTTDKIDIYIEILKQSFNTPQGCHREVFINKNGDITFSSPMTYNSYTELSWKGAPQYAGYINSSLWRDWDYIEYSNGQVAHQECRGNRTGKKEAMQNIADYHIDHKSYGYAYLIDNIREQYEELQNQTD